MAQFVFNPNSSKWLHSLKPRESLVAARQRVSSRPVSGCNPWLVGLLKSMWPSRSWSKEQANSGNKGGEGKFRAEI